MLFTPYNLRLVKAGLKTQTRRPYKIGDIGNRNLFPNLTDTPRSAEHYLEILRPSKNGTVALNAKVGNFYAAQPGRGKAGEGYIEITDLWFEELDQITEHDARAEGYANVEMFFYVWQTLYGKYSDIGEYVWVREFKYWPEKPDYAK